MKTPHLVSALLLALTIALSTASAREWTNRQGRTIEADLIEVKGAAGSEIGIFRYSNGRQVEIPLSLLSDEDKAFAIENADSPEMLAKEEESEEKAPSGPSVFKDLLDGKLVAVDGRRVSNYDMESEPEYFAFYFSASWCGPCREFTPKLVSFYNQNSQAKKTFEVIFVSSDNSDDAMEDYMIDDKMPWPGIKYRYLGRMDDVTKYAGSGIPCLVLVDREGKVISDSYVDGNYRGPTAVMREMEKLAAAKIAAAN